MLTLILGGARSGKSTYAEKYCLEKSKNPAYIATAEVYDSEMADRVRKHRERRQKNWQNFEEAYQVSQLIPHIFKDSSLILLDCMTVYITNLMLKDYEEENTENPEKFMEKKEEEIIEEVYKIIKSVPQDKELIIVSNEVGQGIVPDNFLSRVFRDISGRINQLIAQEADQVYIVWAGIPVKIKPSLERIE